MQFFIIGVTAALVVPSASATHGFLRNYVPKPVVHQPVQSFTLIPSSWRHTNPCIGFCEKYGSEGGWRLENTCETICESFIFWTIEEDDDYKHEAHVPPESPTTETTTAASTETTTTIHVSTGDAASYSH